MNMISLKLRNYQTAAIVLLTFFAVTAPSSREVRAAVAFNTFPISYTQETNRDYALLDARNISAGGAFSTSQADHDNGVQSSAGDIIEFQIYYHNSGIATDEATNVTIKASLPGGTRNAHEVWASIDSDQISPVYSSDSGRGGNMTVHVGGNSQTLELISGSVRHYPNRSFSAITPSSGDNLLGSGLNIGTIKGCFDFSGIVTFRARVGTSAVTTEERGLSIQKRVLNVTKSETVFRDSAPANPGDRVRFEIRMDTSGNASQTNVIMRDILPAQLNYVSGSLRIDGLVIGNESEFFGTGRNLGTLGAGASRLITFDANVASVMSGNTTLFNTANVRSDQVATRQDDAVVNVQTVAGAQISLRKTAFNLTQGADAMAVTANPGDTIVFNLFYKNSGNADAANAIIEDNIADVMELAQVVDTGGAVVDANIVRFPAFTAPAGVEVSRNFRVRVREANAFPLGSDLVMVNIYGNEIRVNVRKPQVLGATTPPRTGASEWLPVILAAAVTAGYTLYRRKALVFE